MFTKMRYIDQAFRYIRVFTACLVLACVGLSVWAIYDSHRAVLRAGQRIYLLADGKVLEAVARDRKDNLPVEARDHVRVFHECFYNLDPDEKANAETIRKALYLADISAEHAYEDLKEAGYYDKIVAGNITQRVQIDSVSVNTDSYPYYFRCYGELTITRITSITVRDLVTEGYLRDVDRSDNNPHGFLIERWSVLENKDLKTTARQ